MFHLSLSSLPMFFVQSLELLMCQIQIHLVLPSLSLTDKTLMIDVQAQEIIESDLQSSLKLAHAEAVKYIDPQIRLAEKAGKQKKEHKLSMVMDKCFEKIKSMSEEPMETIFTYSAYGKFERGEALDNITQDISAKLIEEGDEDCFKVLPKAVDTVRKQEILCTS